MSLTMSDLESALQDRTAELRELEVLEKPCLMNWILFVVESVQEKLLEESLPIPFSLGERS